MVYKRVPFVLKPNRILRSMEKEFNFPPYEDHLWLKNNAEKINKKEQCKEEGKMFKYYFWLASNWSKNAIKYVSGLFDKKPDLFELGEYNHKSPWVKKHT